MIHLQDEPLKALGGLNRVCRPGGMLIIPTCMNRDQKSLRGGRDDGEMTKHHIIVYRRHSNSLDSKQIL